MAATTDSPFKFPLCIVGLSSEFLELWNVPLCLWFCEVFGWKTPQFQVISGFFCLKKVPFFTKMWMIFQTYTIPQNEWKRKHFFTGTALKSLFFLLLWYNQWEWVTWQQYSILIFQYKLLIHLKCYTLIQIPSQSDIWLRWYEQFLEVQKQCIP